MYEYYVFINDGIIYDTTDGCNKQYRCANEIWILSVLAFTHRVIIDRCINTTGHGRIKIGGITGDDMTYLKQKMCMIGTEKSTMK